MDISEDTYEMLQSSSKEEWIQTLQDGIDQSEMFLLIRDLHIQLPSSYKKEASIITSVIEEWDSDHWKSALKEIYQHPKCGRFIPKIDEVFIEEIKKEVEEALSKTVARRE